MVRDDAWDIVRETGKFRLKVKDESAAPLGVHPQLFDTQADAAAMRDQLMAWSANERVIVVEHLLLRPKFPGDALYPACCDGACSTCGDEDPYSFRLTFVMPGWTAQYTDNLDLRRFAERTIQQETPAHLLGKTCWVGNDGFVENPCDEVDRRTGGPADGQRHDRRRTSPADEACACANAIYHAFSTVFVAWYDDKTLDFIHADALAVLIDAEFRRSIKSVGRHVHDGPGRGALGGCASAHDEAFRRHRAARLAVRTLRGRMVQVARRQRGHRLDRGAPAASASRRSSKRILLTASVQHAALCECAQAILTHTA